MYLMKLHKRILERFKTWFRNLSVAKARIFYIALALSLLVIIIHNPFSGYHTSYYNQWWDISGWETSSPFDVGVFTQYDTCKFSFMLKGLISIALLARLSFWLVDIRSSQPLPREDEK